eukprot:TRINITY_DN1154_c0_g1_i2.p1 TRINITY_DN1154_c0_g1~~TRINITY_DN1154_c0_g1_i2.p1  ORF type:complete len:858 (+),score=171.18 TRINITY_DN1154_c0_g1_i2:21-2594(+)
MATHPARPGDIAMGDSQTGGPSGSGRGSDEPLNQPPLIKDSKDEGDEPSSAHVYPAEFVSDYLESIVEGQRMKRLTVSFYGYLMYLVVVFVLYFIAVEPSQIYDLETVSNKLGRTTSDAWEKMDTLSDFWDWFQNQLLPNFYQEYWYKMLNSDGTNYVGTSATGYRPFEASDTLGTSKFFRYNLIVGALRLQQKRVTKDSCNIPSKSYRVGDHCYPYLTADNEDTATFTGAAAATYTFTIDSSNSEWWGSIPGQFDSYGPGGFNADFPPAQNKTAWTSQLNSLKDNIWLGYPTRMVSIAVNSYNAGLDMWAHTMFLFEFSASGTIYHKVQSRTFTMEYSARGDSANIPRNVLFAITFWFSIHYMINSFWHLTVDVRRDARFRNWCSQQESEPPSCCNKFLNYLRAIGYYLNAWRLLDIITSTFIFAWLALRIKTVILKQDFDPDMTTTAFVPETAAIASSIATSNQLMGLIMWLMLLKSFKFMEMNKNLAVIWNALVLCMDMLAYFTVAFFIIFVGFAFWGHVTFGSDLQAFATPVQALNTCIDMLIGNGDLPSLYAANRVMGPIFYFLYTVVMTLILVNVFIAIICEAYTVARDDAQLPPAFIGKLEIDKLAMASVASVGLRSYLKKLGMFLTFNLCFTSQIGLELPRSQRWVDVALKDRMCMVFKNQACYFFHAVFLTRFSPLEDEAFSRDHQVYENATILRLCLDRLAEKAELEDAHTAAIAVDDGPMTLMFGHIKHVNQKLECWQGPKQLRFPDGSLDKTLRVSVFELAAELEMLKEMVLTQQGIGAGSAVLNFASKKSKILTDWRSQEYHHVAGLDDFPIELVSLDAACIAALEVEVPDLSLIHISEPTRPY